MGEVGTHHKVSNADVASKSFVYERFHASPSLRIWHRMQLNFWVLRGWVMDPLRRISGLKRNELLRDWEMNQVEVKILQSHVTQRLLASRFDMFLGMVGVPEFRSHLSAEKRRS
jgi:hypothetical protein